jgi:hypothetical protein
MAIWRIRWWKFVAALGSVLLWPVILHAQPSSAQGRRFGIPMNNSTNDADVVPREPIFANGLEKLGCKQGQNLILDVRWSAGDRTLMERYGSHPEGEEARRSPDSTGDKVQSCY